MEFKEYLMQNGVTEEQADLIIKGMPKESFYIVNQEHLDERYEKQKTQLEQAKQDLTTANNLIDELNKKTKSHEDMQQEIETYKGQVAELEQARFNDRKQAFIELGLTKANVRNSKAVTAF